MKKIIAILFAALLLLFLAACGGAGTEPHAQTDAASGTGSAPAPEQTGDTAQPGQPTRPGQPDPADLEYRPETDFDNRSATLTYCDMLETEDAYYLRYVHNNGYLYYYDKTVDDSGVLCPRPECVHDQTPQNKACAGYLGGLWPSLQLYEGRLWYFAETDNSGRVIGLFRMNPDGSEKELVHEFTVEGSPLQTGNLRLYLHRGMLYYAGVSQEIRKGYGYNKVCFGCAPLMDREIGGEQTKAFELRPLLERETAHLPQPLMYFVGDYVYMIYEYDGVPAGDGPAVLDELNEQEAQDISEWFNSLTVTDEIARWRPALSEPEILYRNTDLNCFWHYNCAYVMQDGTPFFLMNSKADPDFEWNEETNPFFVTICRAEADGSCTEVLNTKNDGDNRFLAFGEGCFATVDFHTYRPYDYEPTLRVRGLDGSIIAEGKIPLAFRSRYADQKPELWTEGCWVTREKLLLCCTAYFQKGKIDKRIIFLEYTFTPGGIVEKELLECHTEASWR